MLTTDPIIRQFIDMVNKKAKRLHVQLFFALEDEIFGNGVESAFGYFTEPADGEHGILAVALGSYPFGLTGGRASARIVKANEDPLQRQQDRWVYTLVHEYMHMMQWFNDDPVYNAYHDDSCHENFVALETMTEDQTLNYIKEHNIPCPSAEDLYAEYVGDLEDSMQ